MLLDNEYTLIPHVKLKLTYDNEVVNVVTLKKDDVVDCQYREDGTKKRIIGKIAKIGYKFNSELGAIDGSIYFQIDGSQEYDGNVVYINIDNFLSVRIIKTGSMITNPVCSVDNADQNISLIREDDTGKVQYSKDGLTWKNIVKGGQSPNDPELHPPTAEVLKNYVKKTELDIYKAEVTNKFSEIEIDPSVIASIKSKVHDFESKLESKLDKDKYKEYSNATSEKYGLVKLYNELGINTDGSVTQKVVNDLNKSLDNKLDRSEYHQTNIEHATSERAGISKLYKEEGDNEDGSLTQKYIKELFAKKLDKADYHQTSVEQATPEKFGTVKLFNETGTSEDGVINQKVVSELLDKKLNKDDYHQTTIEEATSDKPGTVKLYNEAGNKEDGTVTQKFVSESLDKKLNKDEYHQTIVENATDSKAGISKLYTGSGTGEDGSITQKGITDLLDTKLNKSEYHQTTVDEASDIKAGILKLYKVAGDNEDGTVTQKFVSDELNKKLDKASLSVSLAETVVGKPLDSTVAKTLKDLIDQKADSSVVQPIQQASATVAGKAKLYSNTGNGIDGSVTQKLVTDELVKKLDKTTLSTSLSETTVGKVLDATVAKTLNDKIENKVEKSTIVNTLTETGAGKILDARQGKVLKDSIDNKLDKNDLVTDLDISVPGKVADASAIKTLSDKIDLLTTQLSQLKTEFNDYKTAHP